MTTESRNKLRPLEPSTHTLSVDDSESGDTSMLEEAENKAEL